MVLHTKLIGIFDLFRLLEYDKTFLTRNQIGTKHGFCSQRNFARKTVPVLGGN